MKPHFFYRVTHTTFKNKTKITKILFDERFVVCVHMETVNPMNDEPVHSFFLSSWCFVICIHQRSSLVGLGEEFIFSEFIDH